MRQVLITGGGSGIGLAAAEVFVAAGDTVQIVGRDEEKLKLAAAGLRASWPGSKLSHETCDLAEAGQVEDLLARIRDQRQRPDILINNAGIFRAATVLRSTEEMALEQWRIHVLAPWRLLRAFAAEAIEAKRELRVVNILSVTGLQAYPGCGFYGATKAALKSLMETARAELRGKGVRITNLFPGATETPIWGGRDVDGENMMDPAEVAAQMFACCATGPRSLVEDLVMRPAGGDL
jgi:NAD(P)-dependent dehydrogenase (short-subunit alcohol dehydrogenase family)